ncbi:MAG: HEPN domain-containing protein [Anaerolineales bacterium]|nr:HEPN domain-containing protein [Anaerolineales bacterium]
MSIRKDTQNWIALAKYDLETARHMLATGRYLYVIFMCHLALGENAQSACDRSHTVHSAENPRFDLPGQKVHVGIAARSP